MGNCCGTDKGSEGGKKCSPCQMMAVLMVIAVVVFLGIKFLGH